MAAGAAKLRGMSEEAGMVRVQISEDYDDQVFALGTDLSYAGADEVFEVAPELVAEYEQVQAAWLAMQRKLAAIVYPDRPVIPEPPPPVAAYRDVRPDGTVVDEFSRHAYGPVFDTGRDDLKDGPWSRHRREPGGEWEIVGVYTAAGVWEPAL